MLTKAKLLSSRKVRFGIWPAVLIFAAGYLGINFLPVSANTKLTIAALTYLIPPIVAVFGTYLAFRNTTTSDKKFWLFLSLAIACLLIGEFYRTGIEIFLHTEPVQPSIADLMYFSSYIFFFLSLTSMANYGEAFASKKMRYLLDLTIIMLFSLFAIWYFVVKPLYIYQDSRTIVPIINMLYPILDIGIITGIVLNLEVFRKEKWAKPEIMVVLGLALYTIGDLTYNYFAATNSYRGGIWSSLLDLSWLGGYFLFFIASIYQLSKPQAQIQKTINVRKISKVKWTDVISLLLFLATISFLIYTASYHLKNGIDYWSLVSTAVVLFSLIIARETIIIIENNKLSKASLLEPLSGLYNRQFFDDRLLIEMARAEESGKDLCVAVIDIDNFNDVNQIYGSEIADALLKFIANEIETKSKHLGVACRIGDDDFAVIMPRKHSIEAYKACVDLKISVAKKTKGILGMGLSLSVGIASFPSHARTKEGLISKTYGALYWAKFHGKNQVFIYDPELIEGPDILEKRG